MSVPEYDADGVLLRIVEYREPEWDAEQRALMLAYERYMSDIGPHGQPMSEATDPRANPLDYDGGYVYVADDPITDWAEKARLDRIESKRAELGDKANMNGLIFPVRKLTYE